MPKFNIKNPGHVVSLFAAIFLLISIPLTIFLALQSESSAPKPAQAAGRDPALWPFSWDSPWNVPIGSKATYVDTQINMSGKWQDVEGELVYLDPTAPLRTLHAELGDWWPDVACNTSMTNRGQIRVPDNVIVPNPTNGGEDGTLPNRAGGALRSDNRTIQEFQYATRCSATGPVTAGAIRTTYDVYGKGIPLNSSTSLPEGYGAHGGSGLSGVGGALRKWEVADTGPIRHALKMTVNVGVLSKCNGGYRWPAIIADSGYNVVGGDNEYFGPVCDFRMGSLTAIHPSVDCQTFVSTALGKRICQALKDYGAYIVDTGPRSWGAMVILGEYGTASAMNNAGTDIEKMFDNLYVISNNTSTTPGGCGVSDSSCIRRQPFAPDFGSGDTTSPILSNGSPTGVLAAGTTSTTLSVTTNETATCKYGTSAGVAYGSIANTFTTTGGTTHSSTVTGLSNGASRTYYLRCSDSLGNINSSDYTISFSVASGSSTLPPPWLTSDIGSVGIAGSASYTTGTFTISGSGDDIWNSADAFRFVYQDLAGDGSVTARVISQTNTDPWAKAGVMIREDLTAGSKNVLFTTTTGNGLDFQYRSATGGEGTYFNAGVFSYPIYLRLTRSGNTITAHKSTDGTNFTQVTSVALSLNSTVKIGLAVTSHNNAQLSQAQFSNVTTQGGGSGKTGDMNSDGKVDTLDLSYVLSKWGTTDSKADVNKDGTVNILDLRALLANWG